MPNAKPNVILITTDQQRFDSVRANGSAFMHTPNMDRLAAEGARFHRAYCPTTVCTPSRVSLMRGQHLSRHGSYNIGTTADDYSAWLSSLLRANGYRTHHIGKAHWQPWGAESPETAEVDEQGTPFADFCGFETALLSIGHNTYGVTSHYAHWVQGKGLDKNTLQFKRLFAEDDNDTGDWSMPAALHQGQWLAESAISFLQSQREDRPFFLNLGFQDPHHPHALPIDFKERIAPGRIPLPRQGGDYEASYAEHIPLFHDGRIADSRFTGRYRIAGNGATAWKPYFQDQRKARLTRSYYYSMVQLIDKQLGQILAALDELGLSGSTMIVYTSDHGDLLGDHNIGQKGPLVYEGVTRIPLLIRYPDGFAPCVVRECVSLVDLTPTILDFAGIADQVKRDGLSLKNRLCHRTALERFGVRIEYKEESDRIRYKCWVKEDWKLAIYLGESFGELYHLKEDPEETRNLFHETGYQEVKKHLLEELLNDMERSEPANARPSRV